MGLAVGLQVDVGLSGRLKVDDLLLVFPMLLLRALSLLTQHSHDGQSLETQYQFISGEI